MKAIQVFVSFGEWPKVEDFVRDNQEEDIFIYQENTTSFVVVAEGECSMGYIKAAIETTFNEITITELR